MRDSVWDFDEDGRLQEEYIRITLTASQQAQINERANFIALEAEQQRQIYSQTGITVLNLYVKTVEPFVNTSYMRAENCGVLDGDDILLLLSTLNTPALAKAAQKMKDWYREIDTVFGQLCSLWTPRLREYIREIDMLTVDVEGWLPGGVRRSFNYMQETTNGERSEFVFDYVQFLRVQESEFPKAAELESESLNDLFFFGNTFSIVGLTERFEFAKVWWFFSCGRFRKVCSLDSEESANKWLEEALLDAMEMLFEVRPTHSNEQVELKLQSKHDQEQELILKA